MKVILIDDDRAMLVVLKRMLSKISEVNIIGTFQSPKEAVEFLKSESVDLAFLDMSMPEENGIETAKQILKVNKSINIVFITSHKQFALEAFDVFPLDYIVKPIDQERLERAISRFHKIKKDRAYRAYVYCFGGIDIKNNNDVTIKWISSKAVELFSYLILRGKRITSRYSIIKDIFEGMESKDVESYLNTTVYQLRKSLEPAGLKNLIISTGEGYSIDFDNLYVDYLEFNNKVKSIEEVNEDNIDEARKLSDLYTGDLFGDKAYIWAVAEREFFLSAYSELVKKLCTWYIDNKRINDAYYIIKKLISYDELDSEANAMLMKVLAEKRDRIALRKHYEWYNRVVFKELGVKPEASIVSLYENLMNFLK